MRNKKTWVYSPKKQIPKAILKEWLKSRTDKYIGSILKPKHVIKVPKDHKYNYLSDIYSKWHGRFFYICGVFSCPDPNALSPSFDAKIARFEFVADKRFDVAYMRHTGQWYLLYEDIDIEEAFSIIEDSPHFFP